MVVTEGAVTEMAATAEECPGTIIPSPRNSSPTERIILMMRMISEQTEGVAIGLLVVMISEVLVVMISEHRVGQVLV